MKETPPTPTGTRLTHRGLKFLQDLRCPSWSVPLALLALCLASYSLLTPWLGFYWDDLPILWISKKLGVQALADYFSTNRPLFGLMVRASTALLGEHPWQWQIFGVICRWLSAVALWILLRKLWRQHSQPALWAAVVFVVYPGTPVQFIPVVFSHFFIILGAFFLSLWCSLKALENPRRAVLWTAAGLVFSLVNLLLLEYFFTLELLRPLLLWWAVENPTGDQRTRFKKTMRTALPYLLVFAGAALWRSIFFSYQTTNYQPALLDALRQAPLTALARLAADVGSGLWVSTLGAWGQVFNFSLAAGAGRLTSLVYAALVVGSALALWFYLTSTAQGAAGQTPSQQKEKNTHVAPWAWQAVLAGLGWLLLGGLPYWTVNLSVNLGFPNSRLLLSFLPGTSLLLVGLLGVLPLPRQWRLVLLSILVGLAVGFQFYTANIFRRDWDIQNQLFWQLSWRMPAIQPGTTLLINDLPVHYSTDNSLSAPLNWMYAPGGNLEKMPYLLYYPSLRLGGGISRLEAGIPIHKDYLALQFEGSTSRVIALTYNPPACLRVLDPQIDPANLMQPEIMRAAARLSNTQFILESPGNAAAVPPVGVFNTEPALGWCYYFEKAELARQQADWQQVASLGDAAFALGDYPNDPAERLVFIEGYAHTAQWENALGLSRQTGGITSLMKPVLCELWLRIEQQTPQSLQKEETLRFAYEENGCD